MNGDLCHDACVCRFHCTGHQQLSPTRNVAPQLHTCTLGSAGAMLTPIAARHSYHGGLPAQDVLRAGVGQRVLGRVQQLQHLWGGLRDARQQVGVRGMRLEVPREVGLRVVHRHVLRDAHRRLIQLHSQVGHEEAGSACMVGPTHIVHAHSAWG